MPDRTTGGEAVARADLAQPNLFDPDDPRLDQPVPFTLTTRGRRLVAPETVPLRLVARGREDANAPALDGDGRVELELVETNGARHARARALHRSGVEIGDIAAQLDVEPLTARVWTVDDPVTTPRLPTTDRPPSGGRSSDAGGGAPAPREQRGLALLAALGDIEPGAVVATTNRIAVAAELVGWLRRDHGVSASALRVVLRVADATTADLVARAWADRLDLTVDRVLTTPWRGAPTGNAVQAVIRASGRDLAAQLGARLAAWPAT